MGRGLVFLLWRRKRAENGIYIYREGGKEMCVHEEERERRRRKRREEEEEEEEGQEGEEGLYLFLHCWKSGGCLQLGWFGSCCKKDREQHTKLYHTMYCSTHKQSK